jgi:hypothetical protein
MGSVPFDVNETREYHLIDDLTEAEVLARTVTLLSNIIATSRDEEQIARAREQKAATEERAKSLAPVDPPVRPTLLLGFLDGRQRLYIADASRSGNSLLLYDSIRLALRGWENVLDRFGAPMAFETEETDFPGLGKQTVATKRCMDRFAPWLFELADAVARQNTVTGEQRKN